MVSRYVRLLSTAILAAAVISPVAAISKISAAGAKFFNEEGDQFYIKGIAYQLVPDDPLIDTEQCTRDAKQMKDLGANAVRVYHVEDDADHRGCMDAFADAGIYLFVDLDTFTTQIEPAKPTWNQTQFDRFTKVLDEFQRYDNVAGVFVGNEVLTTPGVSTAALYVKAAARDLKAYRDSKDYRKIPVGYSAADIAELRPMLQNYLVCGGNSSEALDFFSLNAYEWCKDSDDFSVSGYINLQDQAKGYPVPIFFSETGCITSRPRLFEDQGSILGPDMDDTWSGAVVYEWIEEKNNYGLISYGSPVPASATEGVEGFVRSGTPTPISPDYDNLKSQWATLSPTGVKLAEYSASAASLSTPECPASTAGGWEIDGNPSIPAIGETADPTATAYASATGSAPAPSATNAQGSATGGKEIAGMSIALGIVMLCFVIWL